MMALLSEKLSRVMIFKKKFMSADSTYSLPLLHLLFGSQAFFPGGPATTSNNGEDLRAASPADSISSRSPTFLASKSITFLLDDKLGFDQ